MQFIKPNYIQRLLKLKTPEDIQEWREERKANFPTKAKREANNELRRESAKSAGNQKSGGNQKFNKFEPRNGKFNKKFGRGNHHNNRQFNGRPPGKRPFDQARNQQAGGQSGGPSGRQSDQTSGDEPNKKEPKMTDSSGLNEQEKNEQSKNEKNNEQNEQNNTIDSEHPERSADRTAECQAEANEDQQPCTGNNRTNAYQPNQFKRRRQPTLLEKVSSDSSESAHLLTSLGESRDFENRFPLIFNHFRLRSLEFFN